MINLKNPIIKISQDIFNHMLLYRDNHPGFTFLLRERDSSRSKEKRLENGQWFQGSTYIFVGIFSISDPIRKVPTFGFVVDFTKEGKVDNCHLTVSFNGIIDSNECNFHRELAAQLGINFEKNNKGHKRYSTNNYMANLDDFLNNVYPIATKLLIKYGLSEKYHIKEENFLKRLTKIKIIQEK